MDLVNFDPSVYVQKQTAAVPPGWYVAKVMSAEKMNARAHTAAEPRRYLEIEWSILGVFQNENKDSENKYAGKRVWDRLNLVNPNEQTRSIAEKTLSYAMNAMGLERLPDGRHTLVGIPCLIRLVVQPETAEYDAKNSIRGFKALVQNSKFAEEANARRKHNLDPANFHERDEDERASEGNKVNNTPTTLASWEKELRNAEQKPSPHRVADSIVPF